MAPFVNALGSGIRSSREIQGLDMAWLSAVVDARRRNNKADPAPKNDLAGLTEAEKLERL